MVNKDPENILELSQYKIKIVNSLELLYGKTRHSIIRHVYSRKKVCIELVNIGPQDI